MCGPPSSARLRPVTRLASLALAAVLLAACEGEEAAECPGESVATFAFTGTKVPKGDATIADDDPFTERDCGTGVGYEPVTAIAPFTATLAAGPEGEAAALCRTGGVVYFGQRSGDHYRVETGTEGAVLGGCAPGCSADVRHVVEGDVLLVDGAPAFDGVLVELMTPVDPAACGSCELPCAARFSLAGTLEAL